MCQASFLPFLALFHSSQCLPNPPSGELALLPHEFYLIHCCRLTSWPKGLGCFLAPLPWGGLVQQESLSEMFTSRFLPRSPLSQVLIVIWACRLLPFLASSASKTLCILPLACLLFLLKCVDDAPVLLTRVQPQAKGSWFWMSLMGPVASLLMALG